MVSLVPNGFRVGGGIGHDSFRGSVEGLPAGPNNNNGIASHAVQPQSGSETYADSVRSSYTMPYSPTQNNNRDSVQDQGTVRGSGSMPYPPVPLDKDNL
jgi:hypothetical protein